LTAIRPHGAGHLANPPPALENWATDCFSRFEEHWKMPLLNLVVVLIVVGVALYLINRYIPMASSIKTILNIVVVVAVCVWVLQSVGLWASVTNFRLSR
jgi:predicted membrane protein